MRIVAYNLAVFLSAFLLFQVQPMAAKALLPPFGGSYLVWGTCMAFFQGVLVLGYAWAHVGANRLSRHGYGRLHALLLLAPLAFLPFAFGSIKTPNADFSLFLQVIGLLSGLVGLPFFVLSTQSLVLQRWLGTSDLPDRTNPYVLYAASNLGSLSGLLTYPILVEPFLDLYHQALVWTALYLVLLLAHVPILPLTARSTSAPSPQTASRLAFPWSRARRWLLLSMAGSAVSLGVTNLLTFDIASVPLLWVLPLSLYLGTFVLVFKRRPAIPAWLGPGVNWAVLVGVVVLLSTSLRMRLPVVVGIAVELSILVVLCWRCHGLLARTRPSEPEHLTAYYVTMSIGGFLGSLVISGVLPLVSHSIIEYPLALALAAFASGIGDPDEAHRAEPSRLSVRMRTALAIVVIAIGMTLVPWVMRLVVGARIELIMGATLLPLALNLRAQRSHPAVLAACVLAFAAFIDPMRNLAFDARPILQHRNYYGLYRVFDQDGLRFLQHGTTVHGRMALTGKEAGLPQSYYHRSTPPAVYLAGPSREFKRLGMIGLGTGAILEYLRPGQRIDIYELDPDNLWIARDSFPFIDEARTRGVRVDFTFGDGRRSIESCEADSYDVFIVDAFNSDSIPVHLLTLEAIAEYQRVLKPDGVLLLHISNKMVNLRPLVYALGRERGLYVLTNDNFDDAIPGADPTVWCAMTIDEKKLASLERLGWRRKPPAEFVKPWTDRYSNLVGLMVR